MIECANPLIGHLNLKGDNFMLSQANSATMALWVKPTQVWPVLTLEIQTAIIRLLAGLASNCAVAQFQVPPLQNKPTGEEVCDAFKPG
jgi:hypothetical protein